MENNIAEMKDKIKEILVRNNFTAEDYGRKLRLIDLDRYGVRIQGVLLGAVFTPSKGLTVWNLGTRNSMGAVRVKDLYAVEVELTELFKQVYSLEDWHDATNRDKIYRLPLW